MLTFDNILKVALPEKSSRCYDFENPLRTIADKLRLFWFSEKFNFYHRSNIMRQIIGIEYKTEKFSSYWIDFNNFPPNYQVQNGNSHDHAAGKEKSWLIELS